MGVAAKPSTQGEVNVKKLIAVMLGIAVLSGASIASATNGLVDNSVNASAAAAASAMGGTGIGGGASVTNVNAPTNTNTNVGVNTQGQQQGQGQKQSQKQGQLQGQGQAQNNNQSIAPSQSVNIEGTSFDRMAPTVVAPSLTAAGTGVCLGSVSFGLSGPMAGASFGITKVDKGCEQRSGAALLYNMGYQKAALRVLAGESIQDALAAEGQLPGAPVKTSAVKKVDAPVVASEVTGVDQQILSTNFGARIEGN